MDFEPGDIVVIADTSVFDDAVCDIMETGHRGCKVRIRKTMHVNGPGADRDIITTDNYWIPESDLINLSR
jgi:hypothetical protein